jgi:uncharacterized membrane protein HdeD (DUF308 family)
MDADMGSPKLPAPHETIEAALRRGLSSRWRWHLAEGGCLVMLGVACLWAAPDAGPVFWGAMLVLAAAAMLISIWRADRYPASALALLLAFIAFAMGLRLLGNPPSTALGPVFAAYFTARGVAAILLGAALRRHPVNQWEWFIVSGVTCLIMAMLILSGLPGPYTWMLGVLLGVDLIFGGSSLVAVVLASENAVAAAPARSFDREPITVAPAMPVCEDSVHV